MRADAAQSRHFTLSAANLGRNAAMALATTPAAGCWRLSWPRALPTALGAVSPFSPGSPGTWATTTTTAAAGRGPEHVRCNCGAANRLRTSRAW